MRRLLSSLALGGSLLAGQPGVATSAPQPAHRWWGPLFADFNLTLQYGNATEAVGPIWGTRDTDGTHSWRLSPILSGESEPQLERTEWECLYPCLSYDRFGTEWKLQFLQMLSFSGGSTLDGDIKQRQTLFPFFFRQHSAGGTNDYLAIAPLFGHLRNRLFRDEVRFALFPLWLQTRKRDVTTDNLVAPFFHRRRGGGVSGWQFWPVFGTETKVPTLRTNVIDEAELVPGHRRHFFAWPFVLLDRNGLGGPNPTTNVFFFPTHLRTRSPEMDHTWWLFFSHRNHRARQFEEWAYPWPFLGHARGPGKHANRIWPLWGSATNASQQSDFIAWPFYTHKGVTSPTFNRQRHRFLYFAYSDLIEEDRANRTALRRRDLWPLLAWRRDHANRERLQLLAPLEGIFPHNKSIERLYSPLWSVWRSESDPTTRSRSQSFLWNLWRHESRADSSRSSVLFGLVQTHRTDGHRHWRILGFGPKPALTSPQGPAPTNSPARSTTQVIRAHTPPRAFLTLESRSTGPARPTPNVASTAR